MERIRVATQSSSYGVAVGETLRNLPRYTDPSSTFVLADERVMHLHGQMLPELPTFTLEGAEATKCLSALPDIYRWLLAHGAHRGSTLLALGGGTVCDVAGFVAATYMRGMRLGLAPSTLLAQVDAAVGGKNGLNLDGYKNIVGTFHQPSFVLCDPTLLRSLPAVELRSGLAEMLKCAIIGSSSAFDLMEHHADALQGGDVDALLPLIVEAVRVKADIVAADEREAGLRRVLNLGHTWGHALEATTAMPHGLCVAVGLEFAARLSLQRGLLALTDYRRIHQLLEALNLPTVAQADSAKVFAAMQMDKKRHGGTVSFVLIRRIGEVELCDIEFTDLQKFIQRYP